MKKRFICLLLSAIMILCCFAGCAKEKTEEEINESLGKGASEGTVTLSMYLMSENPVSAKQEALMEKKVNEITEAEFKIRLDLRYFTPDQYYEKLEAHLDQMKKFYDGGAVGKTIDEPKYVDAEGLPMVYYPPVEDFDVDLFYFGGYDKYSTYKSNGYLADITEEINGSSKALKAVINSNLLSAFQTVNDKFYAVPTNRIIGEYKYILLNKEVLKATAYSGKDITSLVSENCQDLLNYVDKYMSDDYVPLYSSTGELDLQGVKFFSAQQNGLITNDFSVIGGTYNTDWKYGEKNSFADMNNILNSDNNGNLGIKDQISILKGYEFKGYYATEEESDKPFAVGCIKGSLGVADEYADDYEIVPISIPKIDTNDIYESLFGVTKYSNSISASMKVLTFLNTNKEFRNLILYGVEGENYTWVDSQVVDANGTPYRVVERLVKDENTAYVMDALKTGNVDLAYASSAENPIIKANMLEHNFNLEKDLSLGFTFYNTFNTKDSKVDPELYNRIVSLNEFSAQIYEKIKNSKNQTELDAVFAEVNSKLAQPEFVELTATEGGGKTPVAYYYQWLQSKGMYSPQG